MADRDLASLPDDARLWLVALAKPVDPGARSALDLGMARLLADWRHKGVAYQGAWDLLDHQILAVAEPTMTTAPSGCAIDGFFRKVARLRADLGLEALPEDRVVARLDGSLRTFERSELADRLADGTLRGETPIADLTLYDLGQLRRAGLWKPLHATWIGRKFRITAQAS